MWKKRKYAVKIEMANVILPLAASSTWSNVKDKRYCLRLLMRTSSVLRELRIKVKEARLG